MILREMKVRGRATSVIRLDGHETAEMERLCPVSKANKELRDERDRSLGSEASWAGITLQTLADGKLENVYDAARRILREGWAEGMKNFGKTDKELRVDMPATRSIRRRARWDAQGDDLHMERVYGGDLDHAWRRTAREDAEGAAYVTLTLPWGLGAMENGFKLFYPAAVLAVLADALEESGRRVCIQLAYHISDGLTIMRLKDANEPLRIEEIVTLCAHPGIYRSIGISASAHSLTSVGWGWGGTSTHWTTTNKPEYMAETLAEVAASGEGLLDEAGYVLKPAHMGLNNLKQAQAEMARILKAMGAGAEV